MWTFYFEISLTEIFKLEEFREKFQKFSAISLLSRNKSVESSVFDIAIDGLIIDQLENENEWRRKEKKE